MPSSDKEVIERIREGEIDRYSSIVGKYASKIKNFVSSKLFKKDDAEDLVQEIFISFYKAIPRFDVNKPVLPYLYTVSKNQLKMYYRSHKPTVPLKEEITAADSEGVVFDEDALNILDKKDRKILLEIAEGFSYDEVAKRYKISLNTLKSRIRRARLKIKDAYEKE